MPTVSLSLAGRLPSVRSDFNIRSERIRNIAIKNEQQKWATAVKLSGKFTDLQKLSDYAVLCGLPLKIRAVVSRNRLLDDDNCLLSVNKLIIDGFAGRAEIKPTDKVKRTYRRGLGLITSDVKRNIRCVVDQMKCEKGKEKVELVISI